MEGKESNSSTILEPETSNAQAQTILSKLKFQNGNKTFHPGQTIRGSFSVLRLTSVQGPEVEIRGLKVQIKGEMCLTGLPSENNEQRETLICQEKLFFGDGKNLMTLEEGSEYPFDIQVPENSPSTFASGKFGWIKYKLRILMEELELNSEHVTIIPNMESDSQSEWTDQKLLSNNQSLIGKIERTFPSHPLEKIRMLLITNKKCYEPGEGIHYCILQERKGKFQKYMEGWKILRSFQLELQLEQVVSYNFGGNCQRRENIVVSRGRYFPPGYSFPCEGILWVPDNIQPSMSSDGQGQGKGHRSIPTPISYQYVLRLVMTNDSKSDKGSEEFLIEICYPLRGQKATDAEADKKSKQLQGESVSASAPLSESDEDFPNASAPSSSSSKNLAFQELDLQFDSPGFFRHLSSQDFGNLWRMSTTSLAPSLPDYNSATSTGSQNATGADTDIDSLPPSYSSLTLA